jgi:hypothetical protein
MKYLTMALACALSVFAGHSIPQEPKAPSNAALAKKCRELEIEIKRMGSVLHAQNRLLSATLPTQDLARHIGQTNTVNALGLELPEFQDDKALLYRIANEWDLLRQVWAEATVLERARALPQQQQDEVMQSIKQCRKAIAARMQAKRSATDR